MMPSLRRKLNYRNIILDENGKPEVIGVLLKTGHWRFVRWLGFIECDAAKALAFAIPVKLQIDAYKLTDEIRQAWVNCPKDHGIQGCHTPEGIRAVLLNGVPRIIPLPDTAKS